jgi:7-carboxy-7-deazaguanine synthase
VEDRKIPLAETFGPTIQGEGNYAGKKTLFIRLAGCDFRCAWCDSKYTHTIDEKTEWLYTEGLLNRVKALNGEGISGNGKKCDHIVITGGNPALYNLSKFIDGLHAMELTVHIETQGSVWPEWLNKVDNVVISPKGPSSRMRMDVMWLAQKINTFAKERNELLNHKIIVKIPVFDHL